jgi:hypothetical protein
MAVCRPTYETKCSAWYVKMVPDSTLDVGTRTSEQLGIQNVAETRIWVHKPVPTNSFLALPLRGHYIALCTLAAAVSDVLCK